MDFIKSVIVPAMCQEKLNPGEKEPESKQVTLDLPKTIPTTEKEKAIPIVSNKKAVLSVGTNGHKKEKKRRLKEEEKDIIRKEFIKLNGQIKEDICLPGNWFYLSSSQVC